MEVYHQRCNFPYINNRLPSHPRLFHQGFTVVLDMLKSMKLPLERLDRCSEFETTFGEVDDVVQPLHAKTYSSYN